MGTWGPPAAAPCLLCMASEGPESKVQPGTQAPASPLEQDSPAGVTQQVKGLWQPHARQVCLCCFSSSICSLHVSVMFWKFSQYFKPFYCYQTC